MTSQRKGKGRRAVTDGDWLTRSQISYRRKLDRATVTKYLDMPGAPTPDGRGRYSYRATIAWIEQHSNRVGGTISTELREQKLRVEAESAAFDLGVKRGAYVERAKIAPTIAAFMLGLTSDLQAEFERILPGKCVGRTEGEIRKLAQEAVDRVLTKLKSGARPLTGKEAAAA